MPIHDIQRVSACLPEHHIKHVLGLSEATLQLGISIDEFQRIRQSRASGITNRYPLVEMRLTVNDCIHIIQEEGLPVPPKSACFYCPFHTVENWQRLATEEPALFEEAAQLEDVIRARRDPADPAYLSSRMKPLREAFSTTQLPLFEKQDDSCDEGYCFV